MGKNAPWFLSPKSLAVPDLPAPIRKVGRSLMSAGSPAVAAPVVAVFASELAGRKVALPEWSKAGTTRYLVVADVPEPVLPRAFSALDLRKPDQRLHVTRDAGAVRRLLVATARREPLLGIIDAYLWNETLTLVTGDLVSRDFPIARVPVAADLPSLDQFEIDADGSYLHWPAGDIHLGVSQILQAVNPMYLADIEIQRYQQDHTGAVLRRIREAKGLRQTDIPGLGERQVRRIEDGISRLRIPAAEKFAAAFRVPLEILLDEIARHAGDSRLAQSAGSCG